MKQGINREHRHDVEFQVSARGVSSDALSAVLGAVPDEAWDEGEIFHRPHSGEARRHRFTRWAIVEHAADGAGLESALVRLVDRATSFRGTLALLPPEAEVSLKFMVTSPDAVMGFYLDRGIVKALAELGCDIDMSIVYGGEP